MIIIIIITIIQEMIIKNTTLLVVSVGGRIKIFLRLKADGKIVVLVTSVASFAKVLYVNKS